MTEMVDIETCPLMGLVSCHEDLIAPWVSSPQRDAAHTPRQRMTWPLRPEYQRRDKFSGAVYRRMTSLRGMVSPRASKMDRLQLSNICKESMEMSTLTPYVSSP